MGHDDWSIVEATGLSFASCAALERCPGVRHAFSTRLGDGGDQFDLGAAEPARPDWIRRRRALVRAVGLGETLPVVLRQVHGDRVVSLTEAASAGPLEADGVVAGRDESRSWVAAVRTADCVPLLLVARDGQAVAAVHAGWRGVAAGIGRRAVQRLAELGHDPRSLVAALGPAVGSCCYRVGREVGSAVARGAGGRGAEVLRTAEDGGLFLDLRRALVLQLQEAGLPSPSVFEAPWCTACEGDRFFSYRRQGEAAGRLMACVGWGPP